MPDPIKRLSSINRRHFMEHVAKSTLGVSLLPGLQQSVFAAGPNPGPAASQTGPGRAKRLIYLYMAGAMSHLDTFDLKPGHKCQGPTKPIATNVSGVQISEHLPMLAQQFDKLAVVRSLTTQTADHESGEYWMRTSYKQIATEQHPAPGPWMQKFRGRRSKSLPDTVLICPPARHPGAGFFDPTFSPLPIADPDRGLENTKPPEYLTDSSFERRMTLIDGFDKKFRSRFKQQPVRAYTDYYSEAVSLLASSELKAFNLDDEKPADRERYGRDPFGQGCLLARRLIENNVSCVEVNLGDWDMHAYIYADAALPKRCGTMDRAVGNLLKDLQDRGLLDETLVVLATEFGRTPEFNYNIGRDHHPAAFCSFMAGGGIKGGQFYGSTDAAGHSVLSDPATPADFNATIATVLGLPLDKIVQSPTGRPFTIAQDGRPLVKLFG